MKRLVTLTLAAGLAACGGPPSVSETQRMRCEYEARSATASNPNALMGGFNQGTLMSQCLRITAEDNFQAGLKPSGNRPPAQPAAEEAGAMKK
jgi:hypothetical protein